MAKPRTAAQATNTAPVERKLTSAELDAIIAELPHVKANGRMFPDLPDPHRDLYPPTIHPTKPEDATWRKSFKVWGCDIREMFPTRKPSGDEF